MVQPFCPIFIYIYNNWQRLLESGYGRPTSKFCDPGQVIFSELWWGQFRKSLGLENFSQNLQIFQCFLPSVKKNLIRSSQKILMSELGSALYLLRVRGMLGLGRAKDHLYLILLFSDSFFCNFCVTNFHLIGSIKAVRFLITNALNVNRKWCRKNQ